MNTFKEDLAEDLRGVFFDADEFAKEHDINGTVCLCVVEGIATRDAFKRNETYAGYDAIHGATNIVHVKKADLDEMPVEGEVFKVDGEIYYVDSCAEDAGVLTISLRANISGWG